MAGHSGDRGGMNIAEQQETYRRFMAMTKWGTILCVIALIGLALFRTNEGHPRATITAPEGHSAIDTPAAFA